MPRYLIGEAARQLGLSAKTLRRWELDGKIPPAPRHPRTGERQYDDALIEQIRKFKDGDEPPKKKR